MPIFTFDSDTNCSRRSKPKRIVLYENCYLKKFFSITFTHRHCKSIEFLHESHTRKHIPDAAAVVKSSTFFLNRKSFGHDYRFFSFVVYSASLKECFEKKSDFSLKSLKIFVILRV